MPTLVVDQDQHDYNVSATLGMAAVAWAAFLTVAAIDEQAGSSRLATASWLLAFALPLTTGSFLIVRAGIKVRSPRGLAFFKRLFQPVFLLGLLTTMGAVCVLMDRHSRAASVALAVLTVAMIATVLGGELMDRMTAHSAAQQKARHDAK